jgi:3-oxoadipate enol-lactonase
MTDLEWDEHGTGEHTLVWAHGLTSSRKAQADSPLAGITLGAAAAGWRIVRYDARGHGESPKPLDPDHYRWDRLAGDMLAVADAAGTERFVAAGASMGAATALYAALAAPERVEALVLVISPTAWDTRAAQRDTYETMASIVEARGLDRLIAAAALQPPSTMFGETGKEQSLTNMAAMDPEAFPHVMRGAARSDLPAPDEIATIEAPTLLLSWAGDDGHPVSTGERLAELLPSAELHVALTPHEVERWSPLIAEFLIRAR